MKNIKIHIFIFLCSYITAKIWVVHYKMWIFFIKIPEFVWSILDKIYNPKNQDEVADLEFLGGLLFSYMIFYLLFLIVKTLVNRNYFFGIKKIGGK